MGLEVLDGALTRATDALQKRKNKRRLIIDLDSTEDPAHGKQEGVAYKGRFAKNCFYPLFAFTSDSDCLEAKLRPGNVHSPDGVLEFLKPMVERYGPWFKLFWVRADAAFANPETYEYCEEHRITYFIRLAGNAILMRLLEPYLNRPLSRPPKNGIQVKVVDLQYQVKSWHKPRRVVAKIEWHRGELFFRIGFVVTHDCLPGKWSRSIMAGQRSKTGSKKARTPYAGTRPVANVSRLTRIIHEKFLKEERVSAKIL